MRGPPRIQVAVEDIPRAPSPLRALAEAAIDINGTGSGDELLSAVAHHARAILGARMCAVTLLDHGDAEVATIAASMSPEYAAWRDYAGVADGSGIYSETLQTLQPLRLTHEELLAHPGWRGFGGEAARHPPLRGLLVVPLVARSGSALGVIQVSDPGDRGFDESDENLLIPLAQIASVAIERQGREDDAERVRRDLAEAQRIAALGSWVYDVEGDRLTWSEETHRIFGLPADEFAGDLEAFMSRIHPDDRREVEIRVAASLWEHRPYRIEHRIIRPDGEVRAVVEHAVLEYDEHGWPRRMIGTVLDVTSNRRVEDELRARAERIALLAADRRRLISETLAAEERARERIADVLHDGVLQDLLVARQDIREFLEEDEPSRELLSRADAGLAEAVAGLRTAVGELHPLTLTHGGLQTALETVARAVARRTGAHVSVRIDPAAAGDHDHLILALGREFLMNAEKHARARNVALAVERIHGLVRLSVEDDGVGMPPDAAAFRVGHLGLPAARERVEVLGGSLVVDSRPRGGTRVVAVIPPLPQGAGADRRPVGAMR